jgi:hypothetical protein
MIIAKIVRRWVKSPLGYLGVKNRPAFVIAKNRFGVL